MLNVLFHEGRPGLRHLAAAARTVPVRACRLCVSPGWLSLHRMSGRSSRTGSSESAQRGVTSAALPALERYFDFGAS